jgi:hypothetical protein
MDTIYNSQIIEDGYNTSYIVSLIISLFYTPSGIDTILTTDPHDIQFTYIQEFIKIRFIESLHRGYSIHSDIINELRNYLMKCDWCNNADDIISMRSIDEFYKYFMNKIYNGSHNIEFARINENAISTPDQIVSIPLVEMTLPDGLEKIGIDNLFKIWLNSNVSLGTCDYKIINPPDILPLYIKRNNKKTKIDIKHIIKFFNVKDNIQSKLIWKIHSFICCNDTIGYYSVIRNSNTWIRVSDKHMPSFTVIDMADTTDVYALAEEVELVFYKLTQN